MGKKVITKKKSTKVIAKKSKQIKKEKNKEKVKTSKKNIPKNFNKQIEEEDENKSENTEIPNKLVKRNISLDFSKIKLCKPPKVQSFKHGTAQEPKFSADYKILKNCVLQATELGANHNKYYALELHESLAPKSYRLFTHYGRTDDLETNPNAGQKETRYYNTLEEAWSAYQQLLKQKTGDKKGYQQVNLISTNIGSEKAINQGIKSGKVDKKTESILVKKEQSLQTLQTVKVKVKPSKLRIEIQVLIEELFQSTITSLSQNTNVKITEYGLQTPLGVLTMEQLNQAEDCLEDILNEMKTKNNSKTLQQLSNKFYMLVPQKLGRASILTQCIDDQSMLKEKRELVQFMKDCLEKVQSKQGNVLYNDTVDSRYESLGCEIKIVEKKSPQEKEIIQYIKKTLGHVDEGEDVEDQFTMPNIQQIYEINRKVDRKQFEQHKIGNEKLMYHGTKAQNLVGILTRGILLPKAVTALGISRTDYGWLGAGIYFGDVLHTAEGYSQPSSKNNFYILLANVALGNIKDQIKTNSSLRPPPGFEIIFEIIFCYRIHTMHGNPDLEESEFDDHEYCIYRQDQFYLQYLLQLNYES